MAKRIRLSMDLMVPDESPTTERQYKHLIKAFEDYTRVVLAPDQKIPFDKGGEPYYTVHEHNSTMRVSCRGCLELADDLQGHE